MRYISPKQEVYSQFTHEQLDQYVNTLERYHEIGFQFGFFGNGASTWDQYAKRLMEEETTNAINTTPQLLELNFDYLDEILDKYSHVNVIDITVGNALPVKSLLQHLHEKGKLRKYVALDFSRDILNLVEKNINEWFGGEVDYRSHEIDINFDRFASVLNDEYEPGVVNLVLYLGGTSHNFRNMDNAFQAIHESMSSKDIFIHTLKLDSPTSRQYFDFNPSRPTNGLKQKSGKVILQLMDLVNVELLNIEPELYDPEMDYDQSLGQRYIRIRLKEDICITFDTKNGERKIFFRAGDTILLLRMWHQSAMDVYNLLERTEFDLLHSSHTPNQEYLLTISRIKRV